MVKRITKGRIVFCCFSTFFYTSFSAILQSVKSELDRQTKLKNENEAKVKEAEASLKNIQAKSKQLIGALQTQVEEHSTARVSLHI